MTMTHDDQFVRYRINVSFTAKGLAQIDVTKEKSSRLGINLPR